MFNEANVDNRLRHLVRGCVIVATTSKIVELLEEDLDRSYPLISVDTIPEGKMLVFSLEVCGFLTFDQGSEVRIFEAGPFEKLRFDPIAYALVKTADAAPFVVRITESYALAARFDDDYTAFIVDQGRINYEIAPGVPVAAIFKFDQPQYDDGPGRAHFTNVFVPGQPYKGDNGYPGFTRIS